MTKENFAGLKRSIIEAGKIMRGEMPAARELVYEVPAEGRNAAADSQQPAAGSKKPRCANTARTAAAVLSLPMTFRRGRQ